MCRINKIIGYKKEVEKLKGIFDFLNNTDKYVNFGVELPKCLLICGEEGVGKTLMAEALTLDCDREVFYIYTRHTDVSDVKKTFKLASKSKNAIVLIDDVDYLDPDDDSAIFEQIDREIDRCKCGEVFTVVTADDKRNLPEYLVDEFESDMVIELTPPKIEEACEIFKPIFDDSKLDTDFNMTDFCCFAQDCTYTYAKETFNKAARLAVYEGADKVSMRHVIKAGLSLKGYELAVKFDSATAYHEIGHAVVNLLLGGDAASIVLYGNSGGYFTEKSWNSETYQDRERRYMVGIAGKACEELFTGESSIGSHTDLRRVSEGIEQDVKVLASQGFEYFDPIELNSPQYNDALNKKVQSDLQKYYDRAKELVVENRPLVQMLFERLKDKFYLLHSEIYEIYNGYVASKK